MNNVFMEKLRKRFPQSVFMEQQGETYLDSASTSLKMDLAIDSLRMFYERSVSNVHRGEHHLSLKVTEKYEQARSTVARFLGAEEPSEIIFTRSSTEGLNFLAETLSYLLKPEDEILVSEMEHHSNFLPWQNLAQKLNLKFKVAPVTSEGELDEVAFKKLLNVKTKIVSLTHVSNVTGVIVPLDKMLPFIRKTPALLIIDAAQSVSFLPIDVQKLDCDFLVFSGHKIFSPSGIGVLYGKKSLLKKLPPYQRGGGTILKVSKEHTDWADTPYKFEAGTPFIEGALALAEVLDFYTREIDFTEVFKWEKALVEQAESLLSDIKELSFLGSKNNRTNILSFIVGGYHSSDLSFVLTKQKLALRSGHHCCMPLMEKLNLKSGAVRASFSVYNRPEDVQALYKGIKKTLSVLKA